MNKAIEEFALIVGELWKYRTETYQVICVEADRAQLRSTSRRTHIVIQRLERLRQAFVHGSLSKVQEAPLQQRTFRIIADLTEQQQARLNRRLMYIRAAEAEFGGSLPRKKTQALIKRLGIEQLDASPPCYTTLYLWTKLYRQAGENPIPLITPLLHQRFARLHRQPSVVQEIIDCWVHDLYLTAPPHSLTDVIVVIICSLEDLNSKRPVTDQLHIPGTTTLYRIIKEYDEYEKDLYQIGHSKALKKHKWSRKTAPPMLLLERIEADTQEVDVFIVNESGEVLGRPYLTVLLAVKPRVIIGYDLSLNPPCIEKTLRALKHSLRSDRVHNGLGQTYILDGGSEFAGAKLSNVMQLLGSTIVFCEPYAPDQKPHVERWFKTHNIQFAHHLRGTTFSNPEERGDYRSEDEAIYTLNELNAILESYLNTYHNAFHRSLNGSPFASWDKFYDRLSPPKRFSEQDIKNLFWSKTSAMPYNGRIGFEKLQWTGPAIPALATRSGKRVKLNIFYDISDLELVWVSHPDRPEELFVAQAVDRDYQQNLTLEMHHLVQEKIRKEAKQFDFKLARQMRVNLIMELHETNGKSARKRKARLEENGSMQLPAPTNSALDTSLTGPALPLVEVLLTEASLPAVSTLVEVKHEQL